MAVSADIAHFSDVIRAYHRIIEIKEKHYDLEVLVALVYGIWHNVVDSEGRPANLQLDKARELMGRITSLYPLEGNTWELYASLAASALLRAQRLQRSLRGFMQTGWETIMEDCEAVLGICVKLGNVVLSDEIDGKNSIINSVRLSLTSALTIIKRQNFEELKEALVKVEGLLEKVLEKSKSGNAECNC